MCIFSLLIDPPFAIWGLGDDAERKQTPPEHWLMGDVIDKTLNLYKCIVWSYLFRSRSSIIADKLHGTRGTMSLTFRD